MASRNIFVEQDTGLDDLLVGFNRAVCTFTAAHSHCQQLVTVPLPILEEPKVKTAKGGQGGSVGCGGGQQQRTGRLRCRQISLCVL